MNPVTAPDNPFTVVATQDDDEASAAPVAMFPVCDTSPSAPDVD